MEKEFLLLRRATLDRIGNLLLGSCNAIFKKRKRNISFYCWWNLLPWVGLAEMPGYFSLRIINMDSVWNLIFLLCACGCFKNCFSYTVQSEASMQISTSLPSDWHFKLLKKFASFIQHWKHEWKPNTRPFSLEFRSLQFLKQLLLFQNSIKFQI